jgi:hypothetical protein
VAINVDLYNAIDDCERDSNVNQFLYKFSVVHYVLTFFCPLTFTNLGHGLFTKKLQFFLLNFFYLVHGTDFYYSRELTYYTVRASTSFSFHRLFFH